MRPLCIHHHPCADGFTSAWVVNKYFNGFVDFHPGVYGEAPPDVMGRDVILVDFSYKRPVLEQLAEKAHSILILDHHKTAQADLAGWPEAPPLNELRKSVWDGRGTTGPCVFTSFDMERSGAQMAWDYFFSNEKRPKLVDYVADRDLWKFALPFSREIAAALFSYDYNFGIWTETMLRLETGGGFQDLASTGAAIERKHHKDITELLKQTQRMMTIGGMAVPVANLPYTMASDAAGKLAETAPFGACYFDRGDGQRQFSLRSRGDSGTDVSEIAKKYGGGGHRNAAGFQVPLGWEGDA